MSKNNSQTGSDRIINALSRVGEFISSITDLNKLLELIMEESKVVADAEASSLMLYDGESNQLYFEIALGDKADAVKQIRLDLGEGIAGTCAKERRIINIQDASKDDRHFKQADQVSQFKTKSIMAVPLISKNKLIGVLEVLNKIGKDQFDEEDEKVLKIFSDQAAIAIENSQLIVANIQAEKLAAMGQALASISHYVKNILSATKGSISVMDNALEKDNFDVIKQIFPVLKRSNLKMSGLVQDMLTYSKERKPEFAISNINTVIEDVINMNSESAKNKNVKLSAFFSEDISDSMFEEKSIMDAVLNLVGNAIDCVEESKGKVSVSSQLLNGNKIVLKIIDNGCGIPADIQKKIFDPFFSTKGSKGTGLGLAVTKKVIEEHKGTIELISEIDKGTTFIITIPYILS